MHRMKRAVKLTSFDGKFGKPPLRITEPEVDMETLFPKKASAKEIQVESTRGKPTEGQQPRA